jgi:lysophospholipase L1-like esterase
MRIFRLGIILIAAILIFSQAAFAKDEKLRLIALGDSTTAGTPGFRSPLESPPEGSGDIKSQYTYWIKKSHPDWVVLNHGVAGERADEIFYRYRDGTRDIEHDVLVVLAGVNDLYQGLARGWVTMNLAGIYGQARRDGTQVLACSILPYNGATPEIRAKMKEVNRWIRDYAQSTEIPFCDTYAALEHPKQPGKLVSDADGLHPDAEGYRILGETINRCLEQYVLPSLSAS